MNDVVSMFCRPRPSRIWILLAGGVLLTLFGWSIRRNSKTVMEEGSSKVSFELKDNHIHMRTVASSPKRKQLSVSQPWNQTTPLPLVTTPLIAQIHPQHHKEYIQHQVDNMPGHFQIHFRPLKYSMSELQAKLDSLQQQDPAGELDSIIKRQLHVCSSLDDDSNDNTTAYYRDLVSSNLDAWYDLVPPQRDMVSSHCWYTSSFKKHLRRSLEDKLSKWNSLYHITEQYSKREVVRTLSSVLGSTNQRVVFHNSTNNLADDFETFLCLPKVYLGGFPKCGTTALYNYLSSHPSIVEPYTKEGQFWREFILAEDSDYRRLEVLLYLYHFKGAASKIKYDTERKMTLDSSASTVFASAQRWVDIEKDMCLVPHLLSKVLPSVKFIFILRDPVERLWSDYWYFCSKDYFHSNVPEELLNKASEIFHNHSISVIEEFIDCLSEGSSEFKCTMLAHSDAGEHSACMNARIGLSLYYFHVVRWLSVFPREQIRFVALEDLKRNPYPVLEQLWRFLDLSPLSKHQLPKHVTSNSNLWIKSEKYRDSFKMWPETERILRSFFQPYNLRLAKLLHDEKFLYEDLNST